MDTKRKTITVNVTEEEHKKAKVVSAMTGMTLRQIFMEAIERLEKAQKEKNV